MELFEHPPNWESILGLKFQSLLAYVPSGFKHFSGKLLQALKGSGILTQLTERWLPISEVAGLYLALCNFYWTCIFYYSYVTRVFLYRVSHIHSRAGIALRNNSFLATVFMLTWVWVRTTFPPLPWCIENKQTGKTKNRNRGAYMKKLFDWFNWGLLCSGKWHTYLSTILQYLGGDVESKQGLSCT